MENLKKFEEFINEEWDHLDEFRFTNKKEVDEDFGKRILKAIKEEQPKVDYDAPYSVMARNAEKYRPYAYSCTVNIDGEDIRVSGYANKYPEVSIKKEGEDVKNLEISSNLTKKIVNTLVKNLHNQKDYQFN